MAVRRSTSGASGVCSDRLLRSMRTATRQEAVAESRTSADTGAAVASGAPISSGDADTVS